MKLRKAIFALIMTALLSAAASASDFAAPLEIALPAWADKVIAALPSPDGSHIIFIRGGRSLFICKTRAGKALTIAAALSPDRYVRDGAARDFLEFSTVLEDPDPTASVTAVSSAGRIWFFTSGTLGSNRRLYSFPENMPDDISYEKTDLPIQSLAAAPHGALATLSAGGAECRLELHTGSPPELTAQFSPEDGACPSSAPVVADGGVFYFNRRTVFALSAIDLSPSGRFDTRDDVVFITPEIDSILAVTHRFNADVVGEFESSRLHSLDPQNLTQKALFTTTMKITSLLPSPRGVIAIAYKFDKPGNHAILLEPEKLLRMADLPAESPDFTSAAATAGALLLKTPSGAAAVSPETLEIITTVPTGAAELLTAGCALYSLSDNHSQITELDPQTLSPGSQFSFTAPTTATFGAHPIEESASASDCPRNSTIFITAGRSLYIFN